MKRTQQYTLKAILALAACCGLATAEGIKSDPRGVTIEELRNDHASFMVRVDVDNPKRTYRRGEEMRVTVVSAKAGYLYLLYCDAGRDVTCLFPNAFGQDNRIAAKRPLVIPQPPRPGKPSFRLRIGAPFGKEVLKAIVSAKPMEPDALGRLMSAESAEARLAGVRAVYIDGAKDTADWAEHHVTIVTRDAAGETPVRAQGGAPPAGSDAIPAGGPPRRVGVFVGISKFRDDRVRDLSVCDKDATAVANVMREHGKVGQGWVLLNEQATRKNIEQVIRSKVAAATRPGDSVIIYWSGHGSRCADDGGDERDGFDEYLVPYDGNLDNINTIRNTMIIDDTFGRWIQELDGRRVVVVLDTCHSGGQSEGQKSIAGGKFDFLDGEFARLKDIGQRDTALLASSTASQVSFERKEGDLSTMTYFFVSQLENARGPVTLEEVYVQLKHRVSNYVRRRFPGATQTPVLVNNLASPFHLRL